MVVRETMNLPLAYVLHDHEVATPEMHAAKYATSNMRLLTLVQLEKRDFWKDKMLVWQLLYPLVLDTMAWNYIKQ